MPDIKQLEELEGKLQATRERVDTVWKEAGEDLDFNKVKVYGENMTTVAIAEKVRDENAGMADLQNQVMTMKSIQADREAKNAPTKSMVHPPGEGLPPFGNGQEGQRDLKSIGEIITEHKDYQSMLGLQKGQKHAVINVDGVKIEDLESKTLFQTTAGWAPESIRSGRVVPIATRPIQVIDLIPSGNIGQAAAVYMEETTFTNSAAETAEGAAYAESTFVLTERSQTVRKITNSVPVTDEQLEDVAFAQSYLDGRIRFGIEQRLDNQILNGSGVAPNLEGILNKSGIQTQAKGADPVPDAVYKAMTLIRITGRSTPTGIIMHPNDWQQIRLLRTADGIYIWGNPSEAGPERMWGLPVAQADSIAEGTGLVGSFEPSWIQLLERRGLVVEIGFVGTQFTEGEQTIRASVRTVLVIYRAAAFCTVTGI